MPNKTKCIQNSNSRLHVLRVEFQTYPVQQYKPEGLNMNKENVFQKQLQMLSCVFKWYLLK